MIQYNISREVLNLILEDISAFKLIVKDSRHIVYLEESKLIILLENSFNIAMLEYEVSDLEIIDSKSYFVCNIQEYVHSLNKLCNKDGSVRTEVEVNSNTTKITVINTNTEFKISLMNYDGLSEKFAQLSKNKITELLEKYFTENSIKFLVSKELLDCMVIVKRSMFATGNEVNSAILNKNKLTYCDPQGIVNFNLSKNFSDYEGDVYIQPALLDKASSFSKAIDELTIELDSSMRFAFMKVGNKQLLVSLDLNNFQYPDESDIKYIEPDSSNQLKIKINIAEYKEAMSKFDGLFNSDWKYNNIDTIITDELLANNTLKLVHEDFNASVETYLNFEVIENNLETNNYSFLLPSSYIEDLLDLVISEESVILSFSPIDTNQQNGLGIRIESKKINAIAIKIIQSC